MTQHLHNLWWNLHHDHTFAAIATSLWIMWWVAVFAATALWWPRRRKTRDNQRPRWYKPRHRAHTGATADWSPAEEQADAAPVFTPLELLPSHVVVPEQRAPDLDTLADDVHDAFSIIDAELAAFEARVNALTEGCDKTLADMECPGWDYSRRQQDTQRINRKALKALLDDEPWVFDVTQRFPVLEVTAS